MKAYLLSGWLLFLTACATSPSQQVTQVSSLDALLAGVYDGHITVREIKAYGDFGLGTYEAVDGEMIYLDGVFYQVKSSGRVVVPSLETRTPFVTVVEFEPTVFAELKKHNLDSLKEFLDELLPQPNHFAAIRIEGSFSDIKTRSVDPQSKPYPPLSEVVKNQSVFEQKEVKGTLVGFRCPRFAGGLNVPGYHFHFISADRKTGGHVLAFSMSEGTLSADTRHDRFLVLLPPGSQAPVSGKSDAGGIHALEDSAEDNP